jgi:hypothetical protein
MKQAKAISGNDLFEEFTKKAAELQKKFKDNGGMCLNCGENPGDLKSSLNQMHCTECNEKTEAILKKLRGPGFVVI